MKDLFIQFTVVSFVNIYQFMCVCASFPVGFEVEMRDLILLMSDHCLSNSFREYIP